MARLKGCHFCGVLARAGFTRRWLSQTDYVWVCQRIVECVGRRRVKAELRAISEMIELSEDREAIGKVLLR